MITLSAIYKRGLGKKLAILLLPITYSLLPVSCTDWDDHFNQSDITSSGVEIYDGDVVTYIKSQSNLSNQAAIYQQNGTFNDMTTSQQYTFIVADNNTLDASQISNAAAFSKYTVADAGIAPSLLTDGYGIKTRSGKSVWVDASGSNTKLDKYNITKIVKADNGYVYYVDGTLPVRQSVHEFLASLPESSDPKKSYKLFKELVMQYEDSLFNREASAVIGVNEQGQTVYDSVKVARNTLMDRYNASGIKQWDMFDEQYFTTMFVPSDEQVTEAINDACDSIPSWLGRQPVSADTAKFQKWIVEAAFVNKKLTDAQLRNGNDSIIEGVGLYKRVEDKVNDVTTYEEESPAYWNPSINRLDVAGKETLSNGVAYYTKHLHIPNHIVIYRVKSRFYKLWNAMTDEQKAQHFTWINWENPQILLDAQGSFFSNMPAMGQWPDIYYHELTVEPTQEAIDSKLECSVLYDGMTYPMSYVTHKDGTKFWEEVDDEGIFEVNIPKGEYYLRMGFKHSLTYSVSIYFRTKGINPATGKVYPWQELKKDMVLYAQGSNFHFDRGAASEVPHYGDAGISYPEGFDVDYWQQYNEKAIAYDTDGYTVGIVNLERNGNFEIKVSSSDNARLYTNKGTSTSRTKNDVQQLMMYHWCLRPTMNNY